MANGEYHLLSYITFQISYGIRIIWNSSDFATRHTQFDDPSLFYDFLISAVYKNYVTFRGNRAGVRPIQWCQVLRGEEHFSKRSVTILHIQRSRTRCRKSRTILFFHFPPVQRADSGVWERARGE